MPFGTGLQPAHDPYVSIHPKKFIEAHTVIGLKKSRLFLPTDSLTFSASCYYIAYFQLVARVPSFHVEAVALLGEVEHL